MMRAKSAILIATIGLLALSACDSSTMTHEERVAAGTVAGGILGAVAGTHIAGDGNRLTGAIVGGVAGAAAGNAIVRSR